MRRKRDGDESSDEGSGDEGNDESVVVEVELSM